MTAAGSTKPIIDSTSLDIVSLGEPLYELSRAADGATWRSGFGGDTSNMAIAAARAGARTAYVTAVGDDTFGHEFLDLVVLQQADFPVDDELRAADVQVVASLIADARSSGG